MRVVDFILFFVISIKKSGYKCIGIKQLELCREITFSKQEERKRNFAGQGPLYGWRPRPMVSVGCLKGEKEVIS